MGNSHDEIKRLLKASRTLLSNEKLNEEYEDIRVKYNILSEQSAVTDRYDVAKSIEDEIDDDEDEYEEVELYESNIVDNSVYDDINSIPEEQLSISAAPAASASVTL